MEGLDPGLLILGTYGAGRTTRTRAILLDSCARDVSATSVGEGTVVHVDTFNNPHLAVPPAGSPVMLSFPPEACLVLAHDAVRQETDALAAAEAML